MTGRVPPPAAGSPAEDAIIAKFTSAYESADVDTLVALLTDDAFTSMPPMPLEYVLSWFGLPRSLPAD